MDEREQLLACAKASTRVLNEMERCESEYAYLTQKEAKFKKRAGWVWAGLILCPLLALGGISDLLSNVNLGASGRQWDIIGTVISLALTALCVISIKKHNKRKARMPVVLNEHSRLCGDPLMSWLPNDYRNSSYAFKIIEYLSNMRAKTLQEALNLLETEKHQATMEAIAAIGAVNGTRY